MIPYFNVNVQGKPLWAENRKRTLLDFLGACSLLWVSCSYLTDAWTVLAADGCRSAV